MENETAYVILAQAILDHGVREKYVPPKPRRAYWNRYLYPGDGWKYWLMTTALGQSRIIMSKWPLVTRLLWSRPSGRHTLARQGRRSGSR